MSKRDWSSDVCSSDLRRYGGYELDADAHEGREPELVAAVAARHVDAVEAGTLERAVHVLRVVAPLLRLQIGRASCRESVEVTYDVISWDRAYLLCDDV